MSGDVVIATVKPREPENGQEAETSTGKDPDDVKNCEFCRLLRENQIPIVGYLNVSQTDMMCDRALLMYKLTDHPNPSVKPGDPPPQPSVLRKLDRYEESKFWSIIGLNKEWYSKLDIPLRKSGPKRLVYRKCAYRLHNTRHFAIPLEKKKNVGDILKKNYEDDRKLVKKNQAYDCPWDECPHSFRDPQDLRIHYMFDHESVRLFCCGERYENYDLFLEHYVTSPKETRHATWSAHECWGCQKRFIDQHDFYEHAAGCEDQINPFPCPDPLCPMKYESLMESAEHFFLWHDPAGVIHINEAVYFNLDDISPDLKIVDETQLYITHPLRCWYRCELCKTQFSSERYYQEHISQHASKPHSWLIPNILYCEQCETTSCRVQRDSIIELTNKLIDFSETATFEECEKNPLLLIWRFFLTEEYALMMKTIRALMVADNQRAEQFEIPMLDREEHPPCDDKRLANILDTLCHFLTSDVPAFSLGRKT